VVCLERGTAGIDQLEDLVQLVVDLKTPAAAMAR